MTERGWQRGPPSAHPTGIEEREYHVDGVRWHVREVTGAPAGRTPVVLVQGLVISGAFHVPLMQRLAGEFDLYAPDLPGFGLSEKPSPPLSLSEQVDSLAAWMDVAGLRSAALLGTSYGAQVVADFAARHPERATRAILVSPVLEPAARPLPALAMRWSIEAAREIHMMPLLARDCLLAGPRRSVGLIREMRRHRMEDVAPTIPVPTLVVRGSRDPIVSEAWVQEIADLLPFGRLIVIPGAAHPINFTQPLELSRVLRPFLLEG